MSDRLFIICVGLIKVWDTWCPHSLMCLAHLHSATNASNSEQWLAVRWPMNPCNNLVQITVKPLITYTYLLIFWLLRHSTLDYNFTRSDYILDGYLLQVIWLLFSCTCIDLGKHNIFHDLLSRCKLYYCVWGVITAQNLTPAKRDESILGDVHWTMAVVSRRACNSDVSSWVMK